MSLLKTLQSRIAKLSSPQQRALAQWLDWQDRKVQREQESLGRGGERTAGEVWPAEDWQSLRKVIQKNGKRRKAR